MVIEQMFKHQHVKYQNIRYPHSCKKMAAKELRQLSGPQQDYYIFLAKECFAGFSHAEDNFSIFRYASCNAWLFHSSEFFWKALTALSGKAWSLDCSLKYIISYGLWPKRQV